MTEQNKNCKHKNVEWKEYIKEFGKILGKKGFCKDCNKIVITSNIYAE